MSESDPQVRGIMKSQFLVWFGVIGAAITIFSNLENLLNLANWARWLSYYWSEFNVAFWKWALSWLQLDISSNASACLTFVFFVSSTLVGARLQKGFESFRPDYSNASFIFMRNTVWIAASLIVSFIIVFNSANLSLSGNLFGYNIGLSTNELLSTFVYFAGFAYCFVNGLRSRHALSTKAIFIHSVFCVSCFIAFSYVLIGTPGSLLGPNLADLDKVIFALFVFAMMVASGLSFIFSGPVATATRLGQVLILVGVFIGLNELSKMGIDLRAPPVPKA